MPTHSIHPTFNQRSLLHAPRYCRGVLSQSWEGKEGGGVASGREHALSPSCQSAGLGLGGKVGGTYGWRCQEPQASSSLLTGFMGEWVGLNTSTFPLL